MTRAVLSAVLTWTMVIGDAQASPAAGSDTTTPASTRSPGPALAEFTIDATELERKGEDIDKQVRSLDKRMREALVEREVAVGVEDAPRLRLVLRWLDYERSDYMGKFEVQRPGSETWTDAARFECFTCSASQLTKRVLAELPAALAVVDDPDAAVAAEPGPPAPGDTRPADDPVRPASQPGDRAPLAGKGKAGVALLVVGGAASIAGLSLVIVGARGRDARASEVEQVNYRNPGLGVLGVGLAVAITGAVLLGLDRAAAKRRKATSLSPSFDGRRAMLMWTGRF